MPDTPLNPDAIFTAGDVIHENFGVVRKIDHLACTAIAERAVSAYLAVAQPEVTSVEELDNLPVGTVVLDVYGASVTKVDLSVSSPWIHETIRWFRVTSALESGYQYRTPHLPARVLYRPEVKP